MSLLGQTIIQWFEQFAPKHLAVEGDKIGLQIGSLQKEVKKVMVTLDVTEEVVDEAIDKEVDLLIAHHPILYRSLAHLRTDLPMGRIIEKLIKNDIAVYSAHTNLDVAKGGVNDWLANQLGLKDTELLSVTQSEKLKKLAVFVPKSEEQRVREALGRAGAGTIGNYSHCTFRSEGTGTFLPLEEATPYIGDKGRLEQVDEVRIETIFPEGIQKKVIQAMIKAHPYEEVAYDIWKIDQQGEIYGLGKVGKLEKELTLEEFAQHVKKTFDVPFCRVVGPLEKKVKKIAVLGGDGNKYMNAAMYKGVDAFVTGDVYFHTAHDALMNGLHLVDPGHHIEKVMMKGVQEVLQKAATAHKATVQILTSQTHTEPFTLI
jgi:dinuclear metal center YbgI/SA1388 family protein